MNILAMQDSHPNKNKGVISAGARAYFQQRLYSRVQQLFLKLVRIEENSDANFSRRLLAKRIEKKPEQITRWLSYPGNLTLDTLSDLALGMNCELRIEAVPLISQRQERSSFDEVVHIVIKNIKTKASNRILGNNPQFFESISNETYITRGI